MSSKMFQRNVYAEYFFSNGKTIANNMTLSASSNHMSIGPITINSGYTVTVPTGSSWTVV